MLAPVVKDHLHREHARAPMSNPKASFAADVLSNASAAIFAPLTIVRLAYASGMRKGSGFALYAVEQDASITSAASAAHRAKEWWDTIRLMAVFILASGPRRFRGRVIPVVKNLSPPAFCELSDTGTIF